MLVLVLLMLVRVLLPLYMYADFPIHSGKSISSSTMRAATRSVFKAARATR